MIVLNLEQDAQIKEQMIQFYQDNSMVLRMVEYCEVINPECIQSRTILVDTATEFFSFQSAIIRDENKYIYEVNRVR